MKDQIFNINNEITSEKVSELTSRKILAYTDNMMCVENLFEEGGVGALHSHPHLQIVYVPEGEFEFTVEEETKIIKKGDSVLVKGNAVHSCKCLKKGILLDIFSPMREDFV